MMSFELVLVPRDDSDVGRQAARRAIMESPHIHTERGVPGKLAYYNRATTVHFNILLDEAEDEHEGGVPGHVDFLSDSSTRSRTARLDQEDFPAEEGGDEGDDYEEEDEFGEEDDDDDDPPIDLPPVSVHIPLFRPTFFLAEALGFLEGLSRAANLQLAMPAVAPGEDSGGGDDAERAVVSNSPDQVVRRWQEVHRKVFPDVQDKERLQVWPFERCESFYEYNRGLADLQSELAPGGIEVPPIQPARHEGTVKTLCVWRCDLPSVIPKTDLVLVRRPRSRGLFRRGKLEEFLVPGETIWKMLESFSQSRYGPAPMLIVRGTEEAPGQLQVELQTLAGEPTTNAKRTELAGVVDFEIAAAE